MVLWVHNWIKCWNGYHVGGSKTMTDKQKANISFLIDSSVHRRLKIYCVSKGITMKEAITEIISNFLNTVST